MSTFEGVCIGGPMDGRHLDGAGDTITCYTAPAQLVSAPPHVAALGEGVEIESYRFKRIILERGEPVGVWVHESLSTPGDVLRALVEGYRKEVKHGH